MPFEKPKRGTDDQVEVKSNHIMKAKKKGQFILGRCQLWLNGFLKLHLPLGASTLSLILDGGLELAPLHKQYLDTAH